MDTNLSSQATDRKMQPADENESDRFTSPVIFSGLNLPPLVLASASPRRAEILHTVGWQFTLAPADVDETPQPNESPREYAARLALAKAGTVAAQYPQQLTLGADTIVVVDNEILGKPRDEADARRMLRLLSGREHEVLTAVALVRVEPDESSADRQLELTATETTRVQFAPLTADEIAWYVATGEPFDKAGGYAIQGKAALFIERIAGDYWNVVGLPLRKVFELCRGLREI